MTSRYDAPEIDLSQFDDDFADAPVEEREFDEVPMASTRSRSTRLS